IAALAATTTHAETGYEGWLRYVPLTKADAAKYAALPKSIVVTGDSPVLNSAREELVRGLAGMLRAKPTLHRGGPTAPALTLTPITPHWLRYPQPGTTHSD